MIEVLVAFFIQNAEPIDAQSNTLQIEEIGRKTVKVSDSDTLVDEGILRVGKKKVRIYAKKGIRISDNFLRIGSKSKVRI